MESQNKQDYIKEEKGIDKIWPYALAVLMIAVLIGSHLFSTKKVKPEVVDVKYNWDDVYVRIASCPVLLETLPFRNVKALSKEETRFINASNWFQFCYTKGEERHFVASPDYKSMEAILKNGNN